jgi:hypothetical protein
MHKPRYPRRQVSPSFPRAVIASGIPNWRMAAFVGIRHNQRLSALLHSSIVPASPLVISQLEQVAKLIGFPPDRIFLDEVALPGAHVDLQEVG